MTESARELCFGCSVVAVFSADGVEGEHRRVESLGAVGPTDKADSSLLAHRRVFQDYEREGSILEVDQAAR